MVRLDESSSYPEQATTAPVDHVCVNAAKCYPIMHECCWALIGWSLVNMKDLKVIKNDQTQRKMSFNELFSRVTSLWKFKCLQGSPQEFLPAGEACQWAGGGGGSGGPPPENFRLLPPKNAFFRHFWTVSDLKKIYFFYFFFETFSCTSLLEDLILTLSFNRKKPSGHNERVDLRKETAFVSMKTFFPGPLSVP